MNIVDLAQARERTIDRNQMTRLHVSLSIPDQRLALFGRRRGNPGADNIGHVQPEFGARSIIGPTVGDESAEMFQRAHHSARQRPKCTSARRTISFSTIAIAARMEINPSSLV